MKKIIIIGCGGHARSVIDSIESANEYEIAGFVDIIKSDKTCYRNYKVIGTDDDYKDLFDSGIRYACMGIGYLGKNSLRENLHNKLVSIGFDFPVIVDKTAAIASDAVIGEGSFIGKNSVVNSKAHIGKMTIINSGSIIEHDCVIDDYTHIAIGAALCGEAHIGRSCMIGSNATILQTLSITDNVIVGAGSVVTRNITNPGTYIGIPAIKI